MNYKSKSRAQLIEEIEQLQKKVAAFEALQAEGKPAYSLQKAGRKASG
ncbi:hypothetical protein ES705_09343 [subsurface metagenome]